MDPGVATDDLEQAGLSPRVAGERLGVSAESVVLGVGSEAGADTIKIDVSSGQEKGMAGRFNQVGFETLGPESAETVVRFVKPNGETLLEQLEERRKVAHQSELALAPGDSQGTVGSQLGFDDLQASGLKAGGMRIKNPVTTQEFRIGDGLPEGDQNQKMEVVAQKSIGKDVDPTVVGNLPELLAKHLLGRVIQKEFTINRPADDVVSGDRIKRGELEAGVAHRRRVIFCIYIAIKFHLSLARALSGLSLVEAG
jgi:hypothetical protein